MTQNTFLNHERPVVIKTKIYVIKKFRADLDRASKNLNIEKIYERIYSIEMKSELTAVPSSKIHYRTLSLFGSVILPLNGLPSHGIVFHCIPFHGSS